MKIVSLIVATVVLVAPVTFAKRMAPAEVKPVIYEGIEYRAPNSTFAPDGKFPLKMGVVEAWDKTTGKMLWEKKVYTVALDPDLERDVQDVFITKLEIDAGKLIVTNEGNDRYSIDLTTREVTKVESTDKIICKKEYRLVSPDGDKEIGIYGISAVQMDEPDKKIHITETVSMDLRGKKAEFTSSVIYSGNPRLTPESGTAETKIDGKVCMKGMVTFAEKTVTFGCTGFLNKKTGDAINPPKRFEKKDQPKPQGVLIFQSALPTIGPKFLPQEGELKDVTFVEFPDDMGAPELINFKVGYRLVRDKPDEKGEYDLKIFSPDSEDSINHWRYNKNDQLVSIASFAGKAKLREVGEEKNK